MFFAGIVAMQSCRINNSPCPNPFRVFCAIGGRPITPKSTGRVILPPMRALPLTLLFAAPALAFDQSNPPAAPPVWQMQESGTTAGLRGIDSVDGTVAWASGTGGTVLKTLDGGAHWTQCAIPDAAKDGATLDFRGVQAWDATTAIVMASGAGEKSRLYKTRDGCLHWTLLYTNPDRTGFWDAVTFWDRENGLLLGDPTESKYPLGSLRSVNSGTNKQHLEKDNQPHLEFNVLFTTDGGSTWIRQMYHFAPTPIEITNTGNAAAFAASNSSLVIRGHAAWFGIGGKDGAYVYMGDSYRESPPGVICDCQPMPPPTIWFTHKVRVPLTGGNDSSGIFSMAYRTPFGLPTEVFLKGGRTIYIDHSMLIAVGGDYTKPNESTGTAAWSADKGEHWTASATPPHGFRSAVQWSESLKAWITVGTNGSDISRDDGKTWQPLDNGNWNALSLPFVVGPNGRIARINPAALPSAK